MVGCPQRAKVRRIIMMQLLIAVVVSLAFWLLSGFKAGYSAAAGGAICIVTHALFAAKLFSYSGARQAQAILNAFYYGEALKLILTALLFAGIFYFGEVAVLPLFIGFIATQFGNWLALIVRYPSH